MNKYRAVKTQVNGIKLDSKAEAEYYEELLFLKGIGDVENIWLQPKIYMTDSKILYKPDFKIERSNGIVEYIEVKGFETTVYRLKKRLWKHYGAGTLIVIKKKGRAFVETDRVQTIEK